MSVLMKFCEHCSIMEHPISESTSITYENKYYCSLNCFNSEVNYDKIERLQNEIEKLESDAEELQGYKNDLDSAETARDNYVNNLEDIKYKIEKVYGMYEENKKKHLAASDDAISDLMEYFNDEVYID